MKGDQRKVSQNLGDLQNLLIKLANCFKASAEKARLLYEFSLSLNPGDMTELFIIISSKYRRPVPSKFKEKLMGHLRGSKVKPTRYLLAEGYLLARKSISMKTLHEEYSSKTYIYCTCI